MDISDIELPVRREGRSMVLLSPKKGFSPSRTLIDRVFTAVHQENILFPRGVQLNELRKPTANLPRVEIFRDASVWAIESGASTSMMITFEALSISLSLSHSLYSSIKIALVVYVPKHPDGQKEPRIDDHSMISRRKCSNHFLCTKVVLNEEA